MKTSVRYLWWGGALIFAATALIGCGTSTAGGVPVSQPVTQTGQNPGDNHPQSGTTQPGSGSKGATGSPSSGNGGAGKGVSKTGATTTAGNKSGLALVPTSVTLTGTGDTFVSLSSSIPSVLLPSGWSVQSISSGAGGTIVSLRNPDNSSQIIREVIQLSARDLQGLYNNMNDVQPGSARWVVQNQIVQFNQYNPNVSYEDRGLAANMSTGGSIRVDVYLPDAEADTADRILFSFIGAGATTRSTQ